MIKTVLFNPFIFFLVIGVLVFVFFYIRTPGILYFFKNKTLKSQKEILHIMDQMLLKISPEKVIFRLWCVGLGVGFTIFLLTWPHIIVGFVGGFIGFLFSWMGVRYVVNNMWETRSNHIVYQMVEGLGIMMNAVKVGLSVAQSLERVIKNMKTGALVQEFQLVLNKTHLGMSIEEAFNEMESRINRPDVTMMVVAINILKDTGGNIAETLSIIAETIRSRQKVENKVKALTAQGTMQATIISMVPFGMLIMMFMMDKEYARLMLGTTLGLIVLLIIVVLIVIGSILMRKIVKINI